MPLLATDLDRTLIYSRGAVDTYGDGGADLVAVERYRDADASWMTATAAAGLARLTRNALVVPTTTRTVEQWRRITLPGPPARYAVTTNGATLLVDGEVDGAWTRRVAAGLATVAPLGEVRQHAATVCRPEWTSSLREAEGMFCYAVLHRAQLPAGFVADEAAWAAERGWRVSLQGRKLYWVPRPLTKSAAVAEIAVRTGAGPVLAAGDSLLDADLLAAADAGIMARHGELADSGWRAEHVSVTAQCGVRAGAEIVAWFAGQVAPDRVAERSAHR